MNSPLFSIEDLVVAYGEIRAIEGVSLEIFEGEIIALIGANGSGKSTLINAIMGMIPVKAGRIVMNTTPISGRTSEYVVKSGIAMAPEGRGVLTEMTVIENLLLGAYHYKGNIKERLECVYDRFPILAERKDQMAGTLSGGEQQQIVIGRALMSKPKLLILDEPSLALAPIMVDRVFRALHDLKQDGLTILLSEQNSYKALQVSDRGYVLSLGRVVHNGDSKNMMNDPRVKEAYLGG
jgi:branched-chain amino acid transport system ATP-binding protein